MAKRKLRQGLVSVRQPKGTCDTDMTLAGIQSGVPDARAGDTVAVHYHPEFIPPGGSDLIPLADGQF